MLNDKGQSQKVTYCRIPFIWHSRKGKFIGMEQISCCQEERKGWGQERNEGGYEKGNVRDPCAEGSVLHPGCFSVHALVVAVTVVLLRCDTGENQATGTGELHVISYNSM